MVKFDEKTFRDDLSKIKVWLAHAEGEIPFAMAFTLTKMGQAAKAGVTKNLPRIFKNPTPWTMKSIYLVAAKKTDLTAIVYVKDGSRNSLLHHIEGGKRPAKRFEHNLRKAGWLTGANQYAVPGHKAKRNMYGNMTMGSLNKIVSAVGAQDERGFTANTSANSLKNNPGQAKYFVVKRSANTPAGIYETRGSGANKTLRPVLIFVKKTTYKRRFPFHEIAEDTGYDAMDQAIDDVLAVIFNSR